MKLALDAFRPSDDAAPEAAAPRRRLLPHPVVMMLLIILGALALTWILPSGAFKRTPAQQVVAGSYHVIPKSLTWAAIVTPRQSTAAVAYPADATLMATAITQGMGKSAGLVVMILLLGGMFGVLRATQALDAGMERLLALTGGNLFVLVPAVMIVLSAGSTCLGLISEYLVVIPIMLILAEKMGLNRLFGLALVMVSAKIGYLASVTNPLALLVAQPIVGVPVFSGVQLRLALYLVYLALGIGYVLLVALRSGFRRSDEIVSSARLPLRYVAIFTILAIGMAVIVYGAGQLKWRDAEMGAVYIALAATIAAVARMAPDAAAEAFIDGMRAMMLAAVLVGLASAVEVVLTHGRVLDTVTYGLSQLARGQPPAVVAPLLALIEMLLGVLIPSTSAKAAISLPVLWPIAQAAGVAGQTTALAYLAGNGLIAMVTPTSGLLLAYLASARVSFGAWLKFILPLWAVLLVISLTVLAVCALAGYQGVA